MLELEARQRSGCKGSSRGAHLQTRHPFCRVPQVNPLCQQRGKELGSGCCCALSCSCLGNGTLRALPPSLSSRMGNKSWPWLTWQRHGRMRRARGAEQTCLCQGRQRAKESSGCRAACRGGGALPAAFWGNLHRSPTYPEAATGEASQDKVPHFTVSSCSGQLCREPDTHLLDLILSQSLSISLHLGELLWWPPNCQLVPGKMLAPAFVLFPCPALGLLSNSGCELPGAGEVSSAAEPRKVPFLLP